MNYGQIRDVPGPSQEEPHQGEYPPQALKTIPDDVKAQESSHCVPSPIVPIKPSDSCSLYPSVLPSSRARGTLHAHVQHPRLQHPRRLRAHLSSCARRPQGPG